MYVYMYVYICMYIYVCIYIYIIYYILLIFEYVFCFTLNHFNNAELFYRQKHLVKVILTVMKYK